MKIKNVIAGTGRSGSRFVKHLLDSAGMPTSHEKVFDCRTILKSYNNESFKEVISSRVKHDTEVSWYSVPFLSSPLLEKAKIVHLIRHPLDIYKSYIANVVFAQTDKGVYLNREFISIMLPDVKNFPLCQGIDVYTKGKPESFYDESRKDLYGITAYYIIEWHKKILEYRHKDRYFQYRVDKDDPKEMIEFLGGTSNRKLYNDKNDHHYRRIDNTLTINNIPEELRDEFASICEYFHYQI